MTLQENIYIRNKREEQLVEYAYKIADAIKLTAKKYDETGEFPFEHFDILKQEGYFKLVIPKEYGGDELSLYEILLVQERLAKGSGSTALAVGWHLMTFFGLRYSRPWKDEIFKKICKDAVEHGSLLNVFVTERDTGNITRGGNPTTIAKKVKDGFVITGRKAFATLSPILNHFTILAYIEDEQKIGEFLIEKNASVEIIKTWDTLGMRSTGSHDVALNNVFVKDEALLSSFENIKVSRFSANSGAYTLQLPAIYLGIATAARDFIIDYAENKYSSSLEKMISEAPHVKQKIGEIDILISVSRTLLYALAEKWDENKELRNKLSKEVSIAKYTICNNANKIVELAMNIAGGHSLSKDLPLERYFRDVKCGLYNPPHNDMVVNQVASLAIDTYRENQKILQVN